MSKGFADWRLSEVDLAVVDYFEMLGHELRGQTYNKAAHNAALRQRLNGRSKGSVEEKHMNISAVLVRLGLPFIDGYKPHSNFQGLLAERVVAYLDDHGDFFVQALRGESPARPVGTAGRKTTDLFVDVPVLQDVAAPFDYPRPRVLVPVDFGLRDFHNLELLRLGARFVAEVERRRLAEQHNRPDLARKVEWVSEGAPDMPGYDIRSFHGADGAERHVAVKTTVRGRYSPFYVSASEINHSAKCSSHYFLYRVFDFGQRPRIYSLEGALSRTCSMEPVLYRARPLP